MTHGVRAAARVVLLVAAPGWAQPVLELPEVRRRAALRLETSDSSVRLAEAQERLAGTFNRTRIEIRPQLGVFSFSQPALLASSLGGWLSVSRRSLTTEFAFRAAEVDVVIARLERAGQSVRAQIEAARQYADLLDRQYTADRACESAQRLESRRTRVAELMAHDRITAIEMNAFDDQELARQAQCIETTAARREAALQLAVWIGLPEAAAELRVAEPEAGTAEKLFAAAPLDRISALAVQNQPELRLARQRVGALGRDWPRAAAGLPSTVSLGYFNVRDTGSRAGANGQGYLLGGNTVHPELSWSLPVRNGGERAAWKQVLDAKLAKADAALADLEQQIRTEVARLGLVAGAALQTSRLARQRMELSARRARMVEARFEQGLAPPTALIQAERDDFEAETAFSRERHKANVSALSILSLCGVKTPADLRFPTGTSAGVEH